MKSDEYPDREKLGKAIIFMTGCNPYQGIERELKVQKVIYEEYRAWESAGKSIKRWIELAKITEALQYHLKSRRV